MWLKNDVFDEILGCVGHLMSPEKKWAPVAIEIFYKYGAWARGPLRDVFWVGGEVRKREGCRARAPPLVYNTKCIDYTSFYKLRSITLKEGCESLIAVLNTPTSAGH